MTFIIGFKPVDTAIHHQSNIVLLLKEALDEAKV
jgi:tRNA A37 threonylcarbamoyltransferase TsaD